MEGLKYLVVGAGFFGATIAEHIARDLGEKVVVLDRRSHIGGNCYSAPDSETGIDCYKYGTHVFHTQSQEIWEYVSRFSEFNQYVHRGWTTWHGRVFPMPINLTTINEFYGKKMSPEEARNFIAAEISKERLTTPANLEEQAIALVGRQLYEAFIRGYTAKQWETDPKKLPTQIITRIPVFYTDEYRYFHEPYQGIPLGGYAELFRRMLDHPNIELRLNTDFFDLRQQLPKDCVVIYSGPIDRFFDYKHGELGWRTVDFETETIATPDFQGASVMNFAEESVPFTRIHEFKHLHPEKKQHPEKTVIAREFSRFARKSDEPYYPIGLNSDKLILEKYREEAVRHPRVIFGGRLGSYKYLDMHQAIGAALRTYEKNIKSIAHSGKS